MTCAVLNIENGKVSYNESVLPNKGYPFGTMASFTCNCGYSLSGMEPTTCRFFGHWCWEPPTCNQCKKIIRIYLENTCTVICFNDEKCHVFVITKPVSFHYNIKTRNIHQ